MFGLGFQELLVIFGVALIIFGPKKLPELGRSIGKALAEFKRATDDLKTTLEREVRVDELRQIGSSITTSADSVSRTEPVDVSPVMTVPNETEPSAPPVPPATPAAE